MPAFALLDFSLADCWLPQFYKAQRLLSFLCLGEAALALVSLFERLISWSYSLRPLASDPILEFASRPQFSCKLCMLLAVLYSFVAAAVTWRAQSFEGGQTFLTLPFKFHLLYLDLFDYAARCVMRRSLCQLLLFLTWQQMVWYLNFFLLIHDV